MLGLCVTLCLAAGALGADWNYPLRGFPPGSSLSLTATPTGTTGFSIDFYKNGTAVPLHINPRFGEPLGKMYTDTKMGDTWVESSTKYLTPGADQEQFPFAVGTPFSVLVENMGSPGYKISVDGEVKVAAFPHRLSACELTGLYIKGSISVDKVVLSEQAQPLLTC